MAQLDSRFPPPLTRSQAAARRRQDSLLDAHYPGQHVAFVDEWNGDSLDRRVVAAAVGAVNFQNLLAKLPPDVLERVQLTLVPESDSIPIPSCQVV